MAKKTGLEDLFKKTEPGESGELDLSDLDQGIIKATGVGLKQGELSALDSLAAQLGVARNALIRFAVRWFLIEQRRGHVDLSRFVEQPPPPKKRMKYPGQ